MQKVSPPLLFLGMDFAVGVQVEPSVLLGIEENLMSCPGRSTTVPHIDAGSGRLVPVALLKMLDSALM
jgi:hypothetical protein